MKNEKEVKKKCITRERWFALNRSSAPLTERTAPGSFLYTYIQASKEMIDSFKLMIQVLRTKLFLCTRRTYREAYFGGIFFFFFKRESRVGRWKDPDYEKGARELLQGSHS